MAPTQEKLSPGTCIHLDSAVKDWKAIGACPGTGYKEDSKVSGSRSCVSITMLSELFPDSFMVRP